MKGKDILISVRRIRARSRQVRMISIIGATVTLLGFVFSMIISFRGLSVEDKIGRKDKASVFIEKGVELSGRKGHLTEAIRMYEQALALDPDNSQAENFRGYALYRLGKNDEAIRALYRAVKLRPTNAWGHYNLALALWKSGKRKKAVEEINISIKIGPEMLDAMKEDVQFRNIWSSPEYKNFSESK